MPGPGRPLARLGPGRRAAANTGPAPARLWAHRQATSLPGWERRAQQRMAAAPVPAVSTVRGQWPAYGGILVRYHPDWRPQAIIHCPWTGPPAFSGPAGETLLIKREGLNDAALVRQPHAGHPVTDRPPAPPGRPASSIAGSWRPQTDEPEACWILVVGAHDQPASLLVAVPGSPRAARSARGHIHPIRRMLGTSHAADCGESATHAGGR
jgi:hypothetical protein